MPLQSIRCSVTKYVVKCLLVLTCAFSLAHAKAGGIADAKYTGIENGLSNNSINTIFQDKYGFIWIGTYDGLNRYDGRSFQVFRHQVSDSESLVNNRVSVIAEDKEDRLWIGTKKGLCTYSEITGRFSPCYYQPAGTHTRQPVDMSANEIVADEKGNVFAGCTGQGLFLHTKGAGTLTQVPYVAQNGQKVLTYMVASARRDAKQNVWVLVYSVGIFRFDYKTGQLLPELLQPDAVGMEVDSAGNLWIHNGNRFLHYNPGSKRVLHDIAAPAEEVSTVLPAGSQLWIGTDGAGVQIKDTAGQAEVFFAVTATGLAKSKSISCLYQDRQKNIWVGTKSEGLNFISHRRQAIGYLSWSPVDSNSISGNNVSCFGQDKNGNLWIGTDGSGLNVWNRNTNQIRRFSRSNSSLSGNLVSCIQSTPDGSMWVGTYGNGISRWQPSSNTFEHYDCNNTQGGYADNKIWVLYLDRIGTLWAGTILGALYSFNPQANRFELFDNRLYDILCLSEDREGNLWGGNFDNLVRIDRANRKHSFYPVNNPVRAIREDAAGQLWIGTEGSGLLRFNRQNQTFTALTETNGLSNNSVFSLLEDAQHNLWMSTFNGLSELSPRTGKFTSFYQSDGLRSNQFNYNAAFASPSGELFFGGISGLNYFHPDSLTTVLSPDSVFITGIRINNQPVSQKGVYPMEKVLYTLNTLTLSYDQASLSVDFISPDFKIPDKISYAYFMEGWDKNWNYSGSVHSASYSRLLEGTYHLHIKSSGQAGMWNGAERTITIIVLPPWYRTWWAYLLYALAFATAVALYIRYKNKQAALVYQVKAARMKVQKEIEINQNKLNFFTNIVHEFRTPITLIINPTRELMEKQEETAGLKTIYRNSRRLLSLVDQLLLFRKAESSSLQDIQVTDINLVHVCREVYLCFRQQAASQQIQFDFESPSENIPVFIDREKIEIVLFNLLSNALKFTPEGGRIAIEVAEEEQTVSVRVTDTGCGIPEEDRDKLFTRFYQSKKDSGKVGFGIGLYLAKIFAEAHGGTLIVEDTEPGAGAGFLVVLRKGEAHFDPACVTKTLVQKSALLNELNVENAPPENKTEENQVPAEGEDMITGKPVVLVVDDNADMRTYLCSLLKDKYTVREAENGKQGLAAVKKYLPAIVISDIVMNAMTGLELCTAIKENDELSYIQVILLTASGSDEMKLQGIQFGADDYITKPFEKDLLLARVANLTKSRANLQKYFYNEITLRKNEFTIPEEQREFLNKCFTVVQANIDRDEFTIQMFAREMSMSHSNLYKRIRQVSGQSVNGFIRFVRLRKAAELLISTNSNISETALQVGIGDAKYFREQFTKLFGITPSEYKKKYSVPFRKDYQVHEKVTRQPKPGTS